MSTFTTTTATSPSTTVPHQLPSPPPPNHRHHAFDYIEIPVYNMDTAKSFYSTAFGWKFNDYGTKYAGIQRLNHTTSETSHTVVEEMGGLCVMDNDDNNETQNDGPPLCRRGGPLVILYSQNLEQTLVQVRDASTGGGRIVKEPFSFPGGRRFHFADPFGNEMAVWSDV